MLGIGVVPLNGNVACADNTADSPGARCKHMPYQSLDADKLAHTIHRLKQRIDERLPETNLARLCAALLKLAENARDATDRLTRPMLALRIASILLIAFITLGLGATIYGLTFSPEPLVFREFIEVLEAGINSAVLIGVGVFFLLSLERRLKRRITLASLSQLRSMAHIIDMHQLTKDPQYALRTIVDTPASPPRLHDRERLSWYLDYCSEMLSLTGKIATLYVQKFDDPVVLASVTEVETLTTGLSGKVWQKLLILETALASAGPRPGLGGAGGPAESGRRWI